MNEFERYLARKQAEYGDKFDPSALCAKFRRYFHGARVKVRTIYGAGPNAEVYERTGVVSATTGWRPAFLLMHRSNDSGSSDLLSDRDEIVAVHDGRRYVPLG